MDKNQKNIFVVLGVPRSGTSAIARGLKALGIDFGNDFVPSSQQWNPTGFWEDREITDNINCGVLYALNYAWDSVSIIERTCQHDKKLSALQNAARQVLEKRMQTTQSWGFKDPRTAKIIVFWQTVFASMNLNENYIITLRNPLSVAHSYHKLRHFDLETGLLLWLMHLVPAIDETHDKKRLIVSYEQLMQAPQLELQRMQKAFDLSDTVPDEIKKYADGFLDPTLRHYQYTMADLCAHPAAKVVPLSITVYQLLLDVATDKILLQSPEFTRAWGHIKNEFNQLYPMFIYLDQLLKTNKQQLRTIRSLKRSFLYKLFYPLHVLDDYLRIYRRKSREKRRLRKTYGW